MKISRKIQYFLVILVKNIEVKRSKFVAIKWHTLQEKAGTGIICRLLPQFIIHRRFLSLRSGTKKAPQPTTKLSDFKTWVRSFWDLLKCHEIIKSFSSYLATKSSWKFRVATSFITSNRTNSLKFIIEPVYISSHEEDQTPHCLDGAEASREYSRAAKNVQPKRRWIGQKLLVNSKLSISKFRSFWQTPPKGPDVRLREAIIANRNAPTGNNLHPIHDRALDGPAKLPKPIFNDTLQPSPSSFACPTTASEIRLKLFHGMTFVACERNARETFLGFHLCMSSQCENVKK